MTRVKSGGDDDIASFLQVCPQEDTAGVDVDGAGHLLLQGVHAVVPIQLHLGRDHSGIVTGWKGTGIHLGGEKTAKTESTVPGDLELREPAKWSQLCWVENKCGCGFPNSFDSGTHLLHSSLTLWTQQTTHKD